MISTLRVLVVSTIMVLLGCQADAPEQQEEEAQMGDLFTEEAPEEPRPDQRQPAVVLLSTGAEGFDHLTKLVNRRGSTTTHNNTQFTYWDADGNRHAIILIRKPDTGDFSKAEVVQISVWVNNQVEDREFFFFHVSLDGDVWYEPLCTVGEFESEPHTSRRAAIKKAVQELMALE